MSVQAKTSPANGRGIQQAAENILSAGSPSLAADESTAPSSGNSVSPSPRKSPASHKEANKNADPSAQAAPPKPSGRIEAPQFDLPFDDTEQLAVGDIHTDPDVQVRARMDEEAVEEYAERMREGDTFPPVTVFNDGVHRWLADGFHRLAAARHAGLETISAKVKAGGRRDAIKYALGANLCHGLRRTNADKRRAVEIALKEFVDSSDRQIAELCGVGNQLVGDVRRQVCESHNSPARTGRDGKKYPAKTAASKQPLPPARPDQAPTNLPDAMGDVSEPEAPRAETPVAGEEQPASLHFSLANGASYSAEVWTDGWIDPKAAATKIAGLVSAAKTARTGG